MIEYRHPRKKPMVKDRGNFETWIPCGNILPVHIMLQVILAETDPASTKRLWL
jgi:hypothetical protein